MSSATAIASPAATFTEPASQGGQSNDETLSASASSTALTTSQNNHAQNRVFPKEWYGREIVTRRQPTKSYAVDDDTAQSPEPELERESVAKKRKVAAKKAPASVKKAPAVKKTSSLKKAPAIKQAPAAKPKKLSETARKKAKANAKTKGSSKDQPWEVLSSPVPLVPSLAAGLSLPVEDVTQQDTDSGVVASDDQPQPKEVEQAAPEADAVAGEPREDDSLETAQSDNSLIVEETAVQSATPTKQPSLGAQDEPVQVSPPSVELVPATLGDQPAQPESMPAEPQTPAVQDERVHSGSAPGNEVAQESNAEPLQAASSATEQLAQHMRDEPIEGHSTLDERATTAFHGDLPSPVSAQEAGTEPAHTPLSLPILAVDVQADLVQNVHPAIEQAEAVAEGIVETHQRDNDALMQDLPRALRSKRSSPEADRPAEKRRRLNTPEIKRLDALENVTVSPIARTTSNNAASPAKSVHSNSQTEEQRPVQDIEYDQEYVKKMREQCQTWGASKKATRGRRQARRIRGLLNVAEPATPSDALYLTTAEAKQQTSSGTFWQGIIVTENQQPLPLETIPGFLGEYYDDNALAWIQDPSAGDGQNQPSVRPIAMSRVKERFAKPRPDKDDPWNLLELATHVDDGLRPRFLSNEDSRLLTKLKIPDENKAQRKAYPAGYKEIEKWALLAQAGALTEPHQDSHGYSTFITVNVGEIGFGFLSHPTDEERVAWRNKSFTYVGGRWRYVVLKPGQTVYFPAGTVHFVFRLPEAGNTLAFGGHVLRCSNLVHWATTLLEETRAPQVTNEDITESAPGYMERVEVFVQQALANGTAAKWGGEAEIAEFLRLKEEFVQIKETAVREVQAAKAAAKAAEKKAAAAKKKAAAQKAAAPMVAAQAAARTVAAQTAAARTAAVQEAAQMAMSPTPRSEGVGV